MKRVRLDCRRPVPADFTALAPTMPVKALARHYRTGSEAVHRWLGETGISSALPRELRQIPADFHTQAPLMTRHSLAKHYQTNASVIERWIAESGVKVIEGRRCDATPVPDDFAELAARMVLTELADHYDINHKAVERWFRDTGVPRLVRPRGRPRIATATKKPTVRLAVHRSFAGPKSSFINRLNRDDSLEGQAADHLRHYCAVYRCTEKGGVVDDRASLTHWRYGNAVLTGAELVARAERMGFDPEAWRRIAA